MLTMLLFATVANAQIQKGNIQLGGTLGFNTTEVDGSNRNIFNFAPRAGWFVSDNTAIGLISTITSVNNDVFDPNSASIVKQKSNSFQIGAYARFHKNVVENLYLYLQPSLSFGSAKSELNGVETGDSSIMSLQLAPGMTYFLSDRFALEMNLGNLGYQRNKTDIGNTEQVANTFNLNLNLSSFGLGMSYYIK